MEAIKRVPEHFLAYEELGKALGSYGKAWSPLEICGKDWTAEELLAKATELEAKSQI